MITRTVRGMGNGGHVYLPKELIGKQVVIVQRTKSFEDIRKDILKLVESHLEHVIGIYLHGSYARGEETVDSDIDIWIVTDKRLRLQSNEYEIISSTLEETRKELQHNALTVLSILREARPILNSSLTKELSNYSLNRENTRWYLDTTKSSLEIVNNLMQDRLASSIPNITYSLMTRLRGLYLMKCLRENQKYSNKKLKKLLNGMNAEELYNVYRAVRDKKRAPKNNIDYDLLQQLYTVTKKLYEEIAHDFKEEGKKGIEKSAKSDKNTQHKARRSKKNWQQRF